MRSAQRLFLLNFFHGSLSFGRKGRKWEQGGRPAGFFGVYAYIIHCPSWPRAYKSRTYRPAAWGPNIQHQPHPVHSRDAARDGGREGKIFLRGAKRVKKIKPGSVEVYGRRDRGFEPKKTSTRLASVCLSRDRARFRLLHFGATSVLFFLRGGALLAFWNTKNLSFFAVFFLPSSSFLPFCLPGRLRSHSNIRRRRTRRS